MLWLVIAPFSSKASLAVKITLPSLNNFRGLFKNKVAMLAFKNSFIISFSSTIIVTITSMLAAYALSRTNFKWRSTLLYALLLFSTVVTGIAAMVPLFVLNLRLGLIDSYLSVIFVFIGGFLPVSIFIIKDFFDAIPKDYEEAAIVAGSTPSQGFFRIILPLSQQGMVVIALYIFMNTWGDFLIPFILLRNINKYPISVALYTFFSEEGLPLLGLLSAYSLLYSIPVVVLYIIINKKFGFGFHGGIKG
jgi:multiple sugar transport system permease protein